MATFCCIGFTAVTRPIARNELIIHASSVKLCRSASISTCELETLMHPNCFTTTRFTPHNAVSHLLLLSRYLCITFTPAVNLNPPPHPSWTSPVTIVFFRLDHRCKVCHSIKLILLWIWRYRTFSGFCGVVWTWWWKSRGAHLWWRGYRPLRFGGRFTGKCAFIFGFSTSSQLSS